MNELFTWLSIVLPGAIFIFGITIFLARLRRIRAIARPYPESLVLGAVSHSLRERGELAANLGELRSVHERLLNTLPAGLLWVDQRGCIGAINQAGQEQLGLKPGVVGLDAEFVLDSIPWLMEALAASSGEPRRITDKNARRWEAKKIMAPGSGGTLIQFEDITERENEERRLAIQDRFAELGEMTAGLAHQLKNGLAVLKGQGQLLQRQGHYECSKEIIQEVSSLERLTLSFLQWAKPLSPDCKDTSLTVVSDEAVAEIRRRPCSSNLRIERLGEGRALADAFLLREALLNIIENACHASPVGGKVIVRVSDSMIEVLDEGPGLCHENLERLLRPFESGRPDGNGLGLPLAFKWLSAQGADLSAYKRNTGGSAFVIRWN